MALRVWLPLIKDNLNQGLDDLQPTNLGTISFIDGGKLGKCLSAGVSTQTTNGISYPTNLVSELGTQFSCAIWVKPLGNHVHYNGTFVSSGNWNAKCWSFGVNQNNTKVDIFSKGYNRYLDCEVPVNTWTHLCCTSDNGTVKLYKNGVYIGQATGVPESLDSDATNFCVGRETYANGYFSFNGNINDVRIYDHALSPKEVKLLSQGLVCHYQLNEINTENIIYDSSGYNYHMSTTGNLTTSTNTIRNLLSTHFINRQYALAQQNANTYLPKDSLTVNIWMYCTTWGNPISCTESGGWNFESTSAGLQFLLYISGVGYKTANSGIAVSTLLNAWHMLTGIFDGSNVKIYIDGELKTTTSTGSTNGIGYAANRLVISGEAGGATPASSTFVGEISDVRIYATALSAEDIQALYNTPVSVANNGTMLTQGEFVEVVM